MLQTTKRLEDARILASDGEIGNVEDLYFDDEKWVVRYLIVGTGGWLSHREVLISPYAVRLVDLAARAVAVKLTREQVKASQARTSREATVAQDPGCLSTLLDLLDVAQTDDAHKA